MRDAIGFENLQNFRYLYAPKRRCTNDFTAIYEERISIWKKTRRITPYGFTPKPSVGWTAHWSLRTARAGASLLRRLCTFTWVTLSLMILPSISAKLCSPVCEVCSTWTRRRWACRGGVFTLAEYARWSIQFLLKGYTRARAALSAESV